MQTATARGNNMRLFGVVDSTGPLGFVTTPQGLRELRDRLNHSVLGSGYSAAQLAAANQLISTMQRLHADESGMIELTVLLDRTQDGEFTRDLLLVGLTMLLGTLDLPTGDVLRTLRQQA